MARKLKTYQTSLGFYDLAIAAPSMKAALEAWGAGSDWFERGLAQQAANAEVIAAALAEPGEVLKRPVGSTGPFAGQQAIGSTEGTFIDHGLFLDRRMLMKTGFVILLRSLLVVGVVYVEGSIASIEPFSTSFAQRVTSVPVGSELGSVEQDMRSGLRL